MGTIYLIRHAQASFGASSYDKLSTLGLEQAQILGRSLGARGLRPDVVVFGGMVRHRETAEACLQAHGLTLDAHADPTWNEYDHEALIAAYRPAWRDGLVMTAELYSTPDPRRTFQTIFAEAMARWMNGSHDGDYLESWGNFRARAAMAASNLCAALDRGQTALVFTSGGPIAAVISELLDLDVARTAQLSWTLANAGVTKLIGGERGLRLSTLNEHSHLEHDARLITYR